MRTEIELKLAVAPRDLERLAQAAARAADRVASTKLYTEYYDSPRLALWRRGLTLRLRRDGQGWIQCVKGAGTVEAGLHRRLESETRVAHGAPDLARIADRELAASVRRALGRSTLRPVFRTEFTRRSYCLRPAPGSVVSLCFDHGRVQANGRHERICELELELEEGPVWHLYELAREFDERARVRVEQRSKAERGYGLAGGIGAGPAKAAPSTLREPMDALEAFRNLSFACLAQLDANRAGLLAREDTEYLHQMRVALRRLRAAFSVFSAVLPKPATEAPLAEIRWLSHVLGPARDWDVFFAARLQPLVARHPGHRGFSALQRACERQRAAAQRRARRAVSSRRYQRLLLDLGAWLSGASWAALLPLDAARALHRPVRGYAAAALGRRLRQVRRRGHGLTGLDALRLHRLRIAVKKLRYSATFFAPLFTARRAAPMRTALAALQDALGGINDSAAALRLLEQASGRTRSPPLREARELLRRANAAALAGHRRELKAAWKALRAAPAFWE